VQLVRRAQASIGQLAVLDYQISEDGILSDVVCAALAEQIEAPTQSMAGSGADPFDSSRLDRGSVILQHTGSAHTSMAADH